MKYVLTLTIALFTILTSCNKQTAHVACDESIIESLNMVASNGLEIGCKLYVSRETFILGVAYHKDGHCIDIAAPLLDCNGNPLSDTDEKQLGEYVSSEIIAVQPE